MEEGLFAAGTRNSSTVCLLSALSVCGDEVKRQEVKPRGECLDDFHFKFSETIKHITNLEQDLIIDEHVFEVVLNIRYLDALISLNKADNIRIT
jgi:hypothetical protein